jgi:hypothetical protein
VKTYEIEMLWRCSICQHDANRGLADRYCCNCGHKKDDSDIERMPGDMSERAALTGDDERRAKAGADWICKYCEANQNQLNKCCGNCGGDRSGTRLVSPAQAERIGREVREDFEAGKAEAERIGRELDAYSERGSRNVAPATSTDAEEVPPPKAWRLYAVAIAALVLLGAFLWWLFTPHLVEAKVSQLYWQHDTLIDRYAVHRHEGWTPSFDAVEVVPLGLRHHHYDHVHVGSHRESYSESYACGENCSTSPSYTTCSSNGNGTARCTNHGGTRSCSTKYCSRTAYRTVQDYRDVSRQQVWFMWKAWDWAYDRTVTRSGFTHATAWPSDSELSAWLGDGEKERSARQASYKVTFADVKDGETHFIRPTDSEFERYDLGQHYQLKVNNAGSVEVLP